MSVRSIIINISIYICCISISCIVRDKSDIVNEFNKFAIPVFVTMISIFVTASITLIGQLLTIKQNLESKKNIKIDQNPFKNTTDEIKRVFYIQILLLIVSIVFPFLCGCADDLTYHRNVFLFSINTSINLFTLSYFIRALVDIFKASIQVLGNDI